MIYRANGGWYVGEDSGAPSRVGTLPLVGILYASISCGVGVASAWGAEAVPSPVSSSETVVAAASPLRLEAQTRVIVDTNIPPTAATTTNAPLRTLIAERQKRMLIIDGPAPCAICAAAVAAAHPRLWHRRRRVVLADRACDRVVVISNLMTTGPKPNQTMKITLAGWIVPAVTLALSLPVGSKNSNLPIFNDLQGDQKIAPRPLARLSLVDELETNAGDPLRFG